MKPRGRAVALATLLISIGCGESPTAPAPPPPPTVHVHVASTTAGRLRLTMSTSFQPAEWNFSFFQQFPAAVAALDALRPQHVRLQAISQAVPQTDGGAWDFTKLDAVTAPVQSVTDHSPEFQIAVAPRFMYDANHDFLDPSFQQFADYTRQLVRYYNRGGFSAADGRHASPSPFPITWWGIYNEPNINRLTAAQYVDLYNAVVPAMQSVDGSLHFAAVELADFGNEPQKYLPTFVAGVRAQVDVLATHFYSSCNQRDSDQAIFASVPHFAEDVRYIYAQLATNPALASTPVWVTENNVNADFNGGNGISICNGTTFVTDRRGSSAFFAAWRPYVFAQLGKAGAQLLHHWDFDADAQYGELDGATGRTQLSYWVDYWLARTFPSPPGADILTTTTDDPNVEVLGVKNDDGSVAVMVANRAVARPGDNNGDGSPRAIQLDVGSLGSFQNGTMVLIDRRTDVAQGPSPRSITPGLTPISLTLDGYAVAFVTLR
jgi:hypothetical protein